jgi:hypothetical protein
MKIKRKQLKKIIREFIEHAIADLFLSNANAADMIDQGSADYEDAAAHARKAGKAYFIQNDDEVTVLKRDPNTGKVSSNIIDKIPAKKDAKIFYYGDL